MAFGWSIPKIMLLVTLVFLLFGVPLMAYVAAIRERRRRKELKR